MRELRLQAAELLLELARSRALPATDRVTAAASVLQYTSVDADAPPAPVPGFAGFPQPAPQPAPQPPSADESPD